MEEDILRFYISMNDIAIVHELNRIANLFHHFLYSLFGESALFSERCVYVTTATGLENEVEILIITEKSIELDDVGMI